MTWHRLIILLVTLLYIASFGFYFVLDGNREFVWYVVVLIGFVGLIGGTIRQTRFSPVMLWALSFWGFLHMAGGGVMVGGKILYALVFAPVYTNGELSFFRFDQFVHFYGFAIATVAMFYLLKPFTREGAGETRTMLLAVLAGMGLGALNELVEFAAVLSFPYTNVGGYYNTGLDLLFNAAGALTAVALLFVRDKLPDSLKFHVREPAWLGRTVRKRKRDAIAS